MNHFSPDAIALHEDPSLSYEQLLEKDPLLPRGWYELSKLKPCDRVEFVCDFWLHSLPYTAGASEGIELFFAKLSDIGVYIDGHESFMVYSLREKGVFFQGQPACLEPLDIGTKLPDDYLSFLSIHDGFQKEGDVGMILKRDLYAKHEEMKEVEGISCRGNPVQGSALYPFYPGQCFFEEWRPLQEMGNVLYSEREKTISDYRDPCPRDHLAFPTFLNWLIYYLGCE